MSSTDGSQYVFQKPIPVTERHQFAGVNTCVWNFWSEYHHSTAASADSAAIRSERSLLAGDTVGIG
jgi:hypothetical protein